MRFGFCILQKDPSLVIDLILLIINTRKRTYEKDNLAKNYLKLS